MTETKRSRTSQRVSVQLQTLDMKDRKSFADHGVFAVVGKRNTNTLKEFHGDYETDYTYTSLQRIN